MPSDYRFSNIDTSFGLSSGSPYGTSQSPYDKLPSDSISINPETNSSVLNDNDLYSSLANMFYNTNAMDYQRALDLLSRQNEFSAIQAQINRDFQERMSNTAYQRQAEDLRLAGFNPALILGAGGATTPSGSSASSGSVDLPNLLTSLSSAFTSIYTNAISSETIKRGQDITSETTKRGQNMKLIGDVLKIVGDLAGELIPKASDLIPTKIFKHNVK